MKHASLVTTVGFAMLVLPLLTEPVFAQTADSWALTDDLNASATNGDAAIAVVPTDGVLMAAAAIGDGSRNAISTSAVGASASVSNTGTSLADAAYSDSITASLSVSASNLDSPVSVVGTIDDATIAQGHDNSIAVSAVGASAQFSVTDDVLAGAVVERTLTLEGDISLFAENTGAVTLQTDVGTNGGGAEISGGTRNAVSATAVGASAGVSVLAIVDDGTYAADIALGTGGEISVTATNSGDVRIGSVSDPADSATVNGATISADSLDGTITFMAIGAAGSIVSSAVVYDGSADPNVSFGDVTFNVENSGSVEANVSVTDLSLDGKNSISVGAIGSTVSTAAKLVSYAGIGAGIAGTIGAVNMSSANSGAIAVAGGLANAAIGGGSGVGIGISALGAVAAFALP